jgi:uncharacterized protein YgiB involved in biofilm formation
MRSRRSAATLTLVLIGTATLPGCGDDETPAARDIYRTRADCQRDWGDDDRKCERQTSGTHSGYWYGPAYGYSGARSSTGSTLAPRSNSSSVGTTVARGGFGGSSASHSSSGG